MNKWINLDVFMIPSIHPFLHPLIDSFIYSFKIDANIHPYVQNKIKK